MKKEIGPIVAILLFLTLGSLVKAAVDDPGGVEIYRCKANDLVKDQQNNPDGLKGFEIGILEKKEQVAGRPSVHAAGRILDKHGKEKPFYADLVGIPEFIGANMYLAYFTGSYTSNDGQKPEHFLLTSRNDKVGLWRARITMDNSAYSIGAVVRLKGAVLECRALKSSVYLGR